MFLSCYAGAIDARRTCLAAEMLRAPGGPVAVVAASRVTMPYATTLLTLGLMRRMLRRPMPDAGRSLPPRQAGHAQKAPRRRIV